MTELRVYCNAYKVSIGISLQPALCFLFLSLVCELINHLVMFHVFCALLINHLVMFQVFCALLINHLVMFQVFCALLINHLVMFQVFCALLAGSIHYPYVEVSSGHECVGERTSILPQQV